MAVILGIGAAIGFGVADFIGGLQARRHSVPIVVAISQGTGFTIVTAVVIVTRQPLPPIDAIAFGFLSGVFLLLGVTAYYRGFSIGAMGVVGPIAATAVVIPLAVGLIMATISPRSRPAGSPWRAIPVSGASARIAASVDGQTS